MIRGTAGRRHWFDRSGVPIAVLGVIILGFLAAPIVLLELNLSLTDIATTSNDPRTRSAVLVSLGTATTSTVLIALFGVPLAYLLARFRFPGKVLVSVVIVLPLVLPPVSAGILLLVLYGPNAAIGRLLSPYGITLVDTAAGIVLAQVFVSAPFAIVAARSAFEAIDPEYEEAAASMGAGSWQTFWHVALPMARAGVAAGLVLSWVRAMGEFGATVILAYHPYSLPVLTYVNLSGTGLTEALPLALLALVITAAVLLGLVVTERVEWSARLSRW